MYTVLIQNKFKRPLGEKNNLIPIPLNILKPCKVYCKIISSFETCDYIFLYHSKILSFNFMEALT